jgi:hypothetical protein
MALNRTNPNGNGTYINSNTFTAPMYMKVNSSWGKRSERSESNDIRSQTYATNNRSGSEYTFNNTNNNRKKRINNLKKLSPSIRRKTRKFKNVSQKNVPEQIFEINRFEMTKILEFFSIFFEQDTKKDKKTDNKKKNINKLYVSVTYNSNSLKTSSVIKEYVLSGDKVDEYNKVICNYFKKENADETTSINELLQRLATYDEKNHTKTHNNKTKKFSEMNIEFKQLKKKLFENLKDIFTEKHITFKNLKSLEQLNVNNVNINNSSTFL